MLPTNERTNERLCSLRSILSVCLASPPSPIPGSCRQPSPSLCQVQCGGCCLFLTLFRIRGPQTSARTVLRTVTVEPNPPPQPNLSTPYSFQSPRRLVSVDPWGPKLLPHPKGLESCSSASPAKACSLCLSALLSLKTSTC
ncbi:hypothetical protein BO78DRAFT_74740 [Aspergillus sclerotiicarbonarius CBS 121057]|uniref:Uncharacterized protein n=1 Tax=Aspergillus sclerotiicarbonarius (strain CBS 121057 / IBT 28362) TaxID=1448318 RepID=A0A319EED4_ASPSB|nr:hypothetical protein BO78DRAFT_74740 [Aspergillus sclerotiicarbonarius CBS 121057]